MKIATFIFLIILICCNGCKNTVKDLAEVPAVKLTSESLYNIDSIRKVLKFAAVEDSAEASISYKKGLAEVEDEKVDSAISDIMSSLFSFPTATGYFSLGNALFVKRNYAEALKALRIAERMNYTPLPNLVYKIAAVYSNLPGDKKCSDSLMKYNDSLALHYMEVALQMRYEHPEEFVDDKAFDSLRENNYKEFDKVFKAAKE